MPYVNSRYQRNGYKHYVLTLSTLSYALNFLWFGLGPTIIGMISYYLASKTLRECIKQVG